MERIALWNTAFLGDAVLTLPLLQSLRLRWPGARIDFYVRRGLEGLFASHPALNSAYGHDKRGVAGLAALARSARTLAGQKYDLWISAHSSFRSGMLARLSGAPVRIGYTAPSFNKLFYTDTVDRRFAELEEIERLLQLLEPLGPGPISTWPEIALAPQDQQLAQTYFSAFHAPVLGLHPGSVWATKRWPAPYFAETGVRAIRQGAGVMLFAGPGEEEIAGEVYERIAARILPAEQQRLLDLSGRLSLPLLAACISRLSCYLTNDSGPMHLAWAQHVPVTALFGPTVRQLGFFPRGERSTVFELDLDCRPCGLHGAKCCPLGHHHCMARLLPDAVWQDVEGKLWSGG